METKKEIRKKILMLRDALSEEERQQKSKQISQKIIEMDMYKNAKNLLCFVTYLSEVDTSFILNRAFGDGKKVFVPAVCGNDMRFFEIESLQDLKEGYKGILEPAIIPENEYPIALEGANLASDLMIMPGSVFDEACNRIGYGKGFYDRYLASGYIGRTIAVGFELQIVKAFSFPVESTDKKPEMIITEERELKQWI